MSDTMMTEAALPPRNRSTEIAKLAAALCKAQAAMEGAKKDAEAVITGQTKRTYADLASVWEAARKPLTDNGLSIVQFPRTAGNGVEIETTLLHASGEYMSDVLWVPCSKNDAQGLGSAITYGRRYALMAVTGIAPVDDDGAAAVESYRPATHSDGPRQSSANGRRMAADDPHLVDADRAKGELASKANGNGKAKADATEKTKRWIDAAVQTLNLTDHTVDRLSRFRSDNNDKLAWVEEHFPDEYRRFNTAYENAAQAARAKVAA